MGLLLFWVVIDSDGGSRITSHVVQFDAVAPFHGDDIDDDTGRLSCCIDDDDDDDSGEDEDEDGLVIRPIMDGCIKTLFVTKQHLRGDRR